MSGAVATASAAALKPAQVDRMAVDAAPSGQEAAEEDTYSRLKTLQRQLEFLEIQVRCSWGRGVCSSGRPPGASGSPPRLAVEGGALQR
jgi:hypothetical protein